MERWTRWCCGFALLALPLLDVGSARADEPVKPLPGELSKLIQVCEARGGAPAAAFQGKLIANRRTKPGWKAFLEGSSADARSHAAEAIASALGRTLYRVDLAAVTSMYIGETEKNLDKIFARAESLNLVLFFDEADALFGKRTSVTDANDRYANVDTTYLLQRIEAYEGLVLLSSNQTVSIPLRTAIVAGVHTVVPVGPKQPPPWRALCWRPTP